MIEQLDPFEGRELDRFEVAPRASPADQFGLVEPDMDSARALS